MTKRSWNRSVLEPLNPVEWKARWALPVAWIGFSVLMMILFALLRWLGVVEDDPGSPPLPPPPQQSSEPYLGA